MSRRLLLLMSTVLGVTAAAPVWAQPQATPAPARAGQAFQGYWIGVDPLDGGDSRRSIVHQEDDTFTMIGRDTVLTLCDETDRGVIFFDDGLAAGRTVLESDTLTIACSNTGDSVVLRVRYELHNGDVMVEDSTTPDGQPVSRIVFHRVSHDPQGATPVPPGRVSRAFAGYWMGVDPLDGGDARRSLVRLANSTYAMAARDTMLTLCDGTDRGFASFDDGVVRGDHVLRSNTLTIQCANGLSVLLHVEYVLVNNALMIEYSALPSGVPVTTTVLHRVSPR